MDTLRGAFDTHGPFADEDELYEDDLDTDDLGPPPGIGQDERRMQVRAYNFWASMLEDRNFPSIEDLDPSQLPDFGPSSVLLDFSTGTENPGIAYLGDKLAAECGAAGAELETLSDVPPRSLLSRITDHYLQIIANQAPIGFEAEFVNQSGVTILYRGILLPFSSDDDTIDFIYGVINWKELADARSADELLLEIDQAIEGSEPAETSGPVAEAPMRAKKPALPPITDWADGPDEDMAFEPEPLPELGEDRIFPRPSLDLDADVGEDSDFEMPLDLSAEYDDKEETEASAVAVDEEEPFELGEEFEEVAEAAPGPDLNTGPVEEPVAETSFDLLHTANGETVIEIGSAIPAGNPADDTLHLADWLAAAREQAEEARGSEDRTRAALYDAIGRAWDFAIAASHDAEGFAELLEDEGIAMQERAPMTPVVKLVFGVDYDKTRLTEYAAALSHAQRLNIQLGQLAAYLSQADGGLKGVVAAERRARREEAGKPEPEKRSVPRASIAKKLRRVVPVSLAEIAPEGSEFALVMIRRTPEGTVEVLGEVPQDIGLVEKAAKKLV